MATGGKRGRPQKPYEPSWGGDPITGLYRKPNGVWRIIATGKEFTEPDERRAVRRFLDWKDANEKPKYVIPPQNGQSSQYVSEGMEPNALNWPGEQPIADAANTRR